MSYRAAICDDSEIDRQNVKNLLLSWCNQRGVLVKIDTFCNAEQFLFNYAEQKDYDILLLDIEMDKINGIQLAKQIRKENNTVQIIFITGYSDYIEEGYDVSALHYLMKPLNESKFLAVLDRATEKIRQNDRTLNLMLCGETVLLPLHEIKYLEVRQNYVTIHAKSDYTIKRTLGEFEPMLDERFLRIGRAIIVNLLYVVRVTKQCVYLKDGTALPLPRGAYELINKAIIDRM